MEQPIGSDTDEEDTTTYDFKLMVSGTNWFLMHSTDCGWFYFNPTIPDSVCNRPVELYGREDIDDAIANYVSEPPSPQYETNEKLNNADEETAHVAGPSANNNGKKIKDYRSIPIESEPPYEMVGNRRQYFCRHCSNKQVDKTKCIKHETGCHSNPQLRLQTIMKGFVWKSRKVFQCLLCPFVGDRPVVMPRHVRDKHRAAITGDKKRYKINAEGLEYLEKCGDPGMALLVRNNFNQLPKILADIDSKTR